LQIMPFQRKEAREKESLSKKLAYGLKISGGFFPQNKRS
jgi:hypothetical protein